MELKSNHASILTDTKPISKSRMGLHALLPFPHGGASLSSPLLLTIPRKKTGVLDDVRSSSWLDSMKASSPPHKNVSYDVNSDGSLSDAEAAYKGWQIKYPSALSSFENIASFAKGKRIALFLDYDGTLSPIVDNPDQAFMSDAMRSAVKNVAKFFPTAIISGRSHDKVYEFVGLPELHYAGSHGMDIIGPTTSGGKQTNLFQPAGEFLPLINDTYGTLVAATSPIQGAKVENNKFCVSVHYRNVADSHWEALADVVRSVIQDNPKLRLTHGRRVLEIRPVINWDKGKALSFLLETLGLDRCDDVLPIYVGDDKTDEDAFKVLRERSSGYGVIVSGSPKESFAYYSLRDPTEVMEFLKSLVAWKCSSSVRS